MKIHLDDTSPQPKYQQIVEQFCNMIRNGELNGGEKLPPERELGKENHIAKCMVKLLTLHFAAGFSPKMRLRPFPS